MAESNFVDLSSSPPIETLLETIPPLPSRKDSYEEECNGKKVKYEHEEHDCQNVPYYKPLIDDDCEAFGHSVAAQLRQMSKIQKIFAQRLMAEVCFRGQINAIQKNTWLTYPTNPVQQYQPMQFLNNARRPYANGGADCLMAQNNAVRYQTHVPAKGNPTSTLHYRPSSLVNNQQQFNHPQNFTSTAVNMAENMQ